VQLTVIEAPVAAEAAEGIESLKFATEHGLADRRGGERRRERREAELVAREIGVDGVGRRLVDCVRVEALIDASVIRGPALACLADGGVVRPGGDSVTVGDEALDASTAVVLVLACAGRVVHV
jgi:hypothetical protein